MNSQDAYEAAWERLNRMRACGAGLVSEPALESVDVDVAARPPGALALPYYEQVPRLNSPLERWLDALAKCVPESPAFHAQQRELLRREDKADWKYVTKLLTSGGGWRLQDAEPPAPRPPVSGAGAPLRLNAPTPGSTRPISLPPRPPVEIARDLVGSLWRLRRVTLQQAPNSRKTLMATKRDERGEVVGFVKFSPRASSGNDRGSALRRLENDLKTLWLTETLGQLQLGLPVGFTCFVAMSQVQSLPGELGSEFRRDRDVMPTLGFETPYWLGISDAEHVIEDREATLCDELIAMIYRVAGAGVLLMDLKPQNLVFGGTPTGGKGQRLALVRFIDFDVAYALATVVPVEADDALSYDVRLGCAALMLLIMLGHVQLAETRQLAEAHPPAATPEELEAWRRSRGVRLNFYAHATAQLRQELSSLRSQHLWRCIQTLLAQLPPEQLQRLNNLCTNYFVKTRLKSKRAPAYLEEYNTVFKVLPPNKLDLHTPCSYVVKLLQLESEADHPVHRDRVELGRTVDIHASRVFREIEHLVHEAGKDWPQGKSCEDFLRDLVLSCRRASYNTAKRRLRTCSRPLAELLLPHKEAVAIARDHLGVPWKYVDRDADFNFKRRVFVARLPAVGAYVFYPPSRVLTAATSDAHGTATLLFLAGALKDSGLHQLRACASAWLYAACFSSRMERFSLRGVSKSEPELDFNTFVRYFVDQKTPEAEKAEELILKVTQGKETPTPADLLWLRRHLQRASALVLDNYSDRFLEAVKASLTALRAMTSAGGALGCGAFVALLQDARIYEDATMLVALALRGDLLSGAEFSTEAPNPEEPVEDYTGERESELWTADHTSGTSPTPSRSATNAEISRSRTRASLAS